MIDELVVMSLNEVGRLRESLKAVCETDDLTTAERVRVQRIQRGLEKAKPAGKNRVWVPKAVLRDAGNILVDHFWRHRN
jgi:hypothetical protein